MNESLKVTRAEWLLQAESAERAAANYNSNAKAAKYDFDTMSRSADAAIALQHRAASFRAALARTEVIATRLYNDYHVVDRATGLKAGVIYPAGDGVFASLRYESVNLQPIGVHAIRGTLAERREAFGVTRVEGKER